MEGCEEIRGMDEGGEMPGAKSEPAQPQSKEKITTC